MSMCVSMYLSVHGHAVEVLLLLQPLQILHLDGNTRNGNMCNGNTCNGNMCNGNTCALRTRVFGQDDSALLRAYVCVHMCVCAHVCVCCVCVCVCVRARACVRACVRALRVRACVPE